MEDSYETSVTAAQRRGLGGIKDDDVVVNSVISPELKLDDCVIELVRTDNGMTCIEGGSVDPVDAEDRLTEVGVSTEVAPSVDGSSDDNKLKLTLDSSMKSSESSSDGGKLKELGVLIDVRFLLLSKGEGVGDKDAEGEEGDSDSDGGEGDKDGSKGGNGGGNGGNGDDEGARDGGEGARDGDEGARDDGEGARDGGERARDGGKGVRAGGEGT